MRALEWLMRHWQIGAAVALLFWLWSAAMYLLGVGFQELPLERCVEATRPETFRACALGEENLQMGSALALIASCSSVVALLWWFNAVSQRRRPQR